MEKKMIKVSSPLLPELEEFFLYLKDIWDKEWITNNGDYHNALENALCKYLKVPYVSLFTNGTIPLITALQALNIEGEVITSPYSFVATTHALWWNGIKPVFVDIDPITCNLDPEKVEAAISPRTTAIMPVHVYGNPCDVDKLQEIANKYNLKLIYDAAHAFGVEINGRSVLEYGDMSTLSFHATKVFNTIEGGALICRDKETKQKIDYLKNFGFADETTVLAPGINGKMDEIRAAYGLLNLKNVDKAIERRKSIASAYRIGLKNVKGISFMEDLPEVKYTYSYFPIFVNELEYGETRDELYNKLKSENIFGRRYFYPLISEFPTYKNLESSDPKNLPEAHKIANTVICLPMHHKLSDDNIKEIMNCIIK